MLRACAVYTPGCGLCLVVGCDIGGIKLLYYVTGRLVAEVCSAFPYVWFRISKVGWLLYFNLVEDIKDYGCLEDCFKKMSGLFLLKIWD